MINVEKKPLKDYVHVLSKNKRIVFTRWGDGEWTIIFNRRGGKRNADGSNFAPSIRGKLRNALADDYDALWGMQNMSKEMWGAEIEAYLAERKIVKQWVDSDVLHRANCKGQLYPFIRQCQKRRIAYVGPQMLRDTVCEIFSVKYYIETPLPNCHEEEDRIRNELMAVCNKVDMVCFSAGWMTNIFIHNIVNECEASLIDIGSVFDIYAGRESRSMFSEKGWDKKIAANLGK